MKDLTELLNFLKTPTPISWVQYAIEHQDILLIDHAHCEKKAASTALNLIFRYVDKPELLQKMSSLAREELKHFEQVLKMMQKMAIQYGYLSPSRYAEQLRKHVRHHEPARLVDVLILGAFIEARSCERFLVLIPHLPENIANFYKLLLHSEARHFQDYLQLATLYSDVDITARIEFFRTLENNLITTQDSLFRFHSGVPSLSGHDDKIAS